VARSSQRDLAITNQADAERVAVAVRALVSILFTEDPRVRRAYESWWREINESEAQGEAAAHSLPPDAQRLNALVHDLGLDRYRGWLVFYLYWQFLSAATGDPWEIDVPQLTGWIRRGRGPKHGDTHHEDLKLYVSWYFRHEIKDPPESVRSIAAKHARATGRSNDARSMVQDGIRRARHFLDCLGAPLPE